MEENKLSYEEASKELNKIVEQLESGELPMSKATELFEKAQELIKICYSNLDKAKGKLTEVKENLGKLEEN